MHREEMIALLLCGSIFSKEIFGISVGGSVVDVYQFLLALWGCTRFGVSTHAPKVAMFSVALGVLSFFLLSIYGYETDILLKQGIPGAIVFIGFSALLEETTVGRLVASYRRVCLWAASFGLMQFVLSLAGLALLMKSPGRLDSLAYEPSHYAIAVGPAAYLAMREMLRSRDLWNWRCWVVIGSLLLTVSFTAVVILVVCGLLLAFSRTGPVVALIVLGATFALYTNQEVLPALIRERIEALEEATEGGADVDSITNLSVLSPLSNWEVAKDSLLRGRLLGNGFGGHNYAYYEYFRGSEFSLRTRFGTNAIGGHSLFIRVISEFGVLGLFAYCGWVVYGFVKSRDVSGIWWTLSAIYLIGRAIKLGGLFELGLPLFVLAPLMFFWKSAGGRKKRGKRRGRRIKPRGDIENPGMVRDGHALLVA